MPSRFPPPSSLYPFSWNTSAVPDFGYRSIRAPRLFFLSLFFFFAVTINHRDIAPRKKKHSRMHPLISASRKAYWRLVYVYLSTHLNYLFFFFLMERPINFFQRFFQKEKPKHSGILGSPWIALWLPCLRIIMALRFTPLPFTVSKNYFLFECQGCKMIISLRVFLLVLCDMH